MVGPNPPIICNIVAIGCVKDMMENDVKKANKPHDMLVIINVIIRNFHKRFISIFIFSSSLNSSLSSR